MLAPALTLALLAASTSELDSALLDLMRAASESGDEDDFTKAVSLIALTQPAEHIVDGAYVISEQRGDQARVQLGLSSAHEETTVAPRDDAIAPEAAENDGKAAQPIWIAAPAHAIHLISEAQSSLWAGKVRLGMRSDSGDSTRLDYTIGLEAERELVGWGFETSAVYSLSETNDRVGRDELVIKARGEREAGERWTLFSSTEWERDQLSGFDLTGFFGVGAGYRAFERDTTSWTVRAAPGLRYLQDVDNGDRFEGALDLMSNIELELGQSMRLESETRLLAANNARADQLFKLNTDLGELWSLEVRYRYRHEFDPEPGFEADDTRTDLSLVREF